MELFRAIIIAYNPSLWYDFPMNNKILQTREKMLNKYKNHDYGGAARDGEALLKFHGTNHASRGYADDLYNTALSNAAAGFIDRAIELYTESIRYTFALSGADLSVAQRLNNLAALLSDCQQHDAACRVFIHSLAIKRRLLPADSIEIADSLYNAGRALVWAGRCRDALPALNSALQLYERRGSAENTSQVLLMLASAHRHLGEYEQAISFTETAWRNLAITDIDEHYRVGYYLAQLYEQVHLNREACEIYLSLMQWAGQSAGYVHSGYINLGSRAASLLVSLGEYHHAKDILLRLRELISEMAGHNNLTYANCLRNLAVIHRLLKEWAAALPYLKEAITIKRLIIGGHVRDFAVDCLMLLETYLNNDPNASAEEILLSVLQDVDENDPDYMELLEEIARITH